MLLCAPELIPSNWYVSEKPNSYSLSHNYSCEARPNLSNADVLHRSHRQANGTRASWPRSDRGGQPRSRLQAEFRRCQEPFFLVAVNHQRVHIRIPWKWCASIFSSIPYDDGRKHNCTYWRCLVHDSTWTAPIVSRCGCRWV